ncbi:hypothetical protein JCM11641_006453 [Rhodosporidiobolus odoratus]
MHTATPPSHCLPPLIILPVPLPHSSFRVDLVPATPSCHRIFSFSSSPALPEAHNAQSSRILNALSSAGTALQDELFEDLEESLRPVTPNAPASGHSAAADRSQDRRSTRGGRGLESRVTPSQLGQPLPTAVRPLPDSTPHHLYFGPASRSCSEPAAPSSPLRPVAVQSSSAASATISVSAAAGTSPRPPLPRLPESTRYSVPRKPIPFIDAPPPSTARPAPPPPPPMQPSKGPSSRVARQPLFTPPSQLSRLLPGPAASVTAVAPPAANGPIRCTPITATRVAQSGSTRSSGAGTSEEEIEEAFKAGWEAIEREMKASWNSER